MNFDVVNKELTYVNRLFLNILKYFQYKIIAHAKGQSCQTCMHCFQVGMFIKKISEKWSFKKLPENWFRAIFYFGIVKEDQGLWKILRQSNFASKALNR